MINKREFVVVSKKALEQGSIGFAYRDRSGAPQDSGWRMMYDRNEDRLDLANPEKVYPCGIKKFLHYFPELEEILKSKTFSVWECIDNEWQLLGKDKELRQVPNRMTGKTKVIVLMTRSGGGAILTADPKDMLHGRKEEWEMLLPNEMFDNNN